jgi:hypothetical protein
VKTKVTKNIFRLTKDKKKRDDKRMDEIKPENLAEGNTGVKTAEEGRVK